MAVIAGPLGKGPVGQSEHAMIIASRILHISTPDGDLAVPVSIHAPQEVEPFNWTCEYEIGWPEGHRRFKSGGIDGVQALLHAMQMVGIEIYVNEHHKAGVLRHDRPGSGYGFPLTSNCRDLLIGDDAIYL